MILPCWCFSVIALKNSCAAPLNISNPGEWKCNKCLGPCRKNGGWTVYTVNLPDTTGAWLPHCFGGRSLCKSAAAGCRRGQTIHTLFRDERRAQSQDHEKSYLRIRGSDIFLRHYNLQLDTPPLYPFLLYLPYVLHFSARIFRQVMHEVSLPDTHSLQINAPVYWALILPPSVRPLFSVLCLVRSWWHLGMTAVLLAM